MNTNNGNYQFKKVDGLFVCINSSTGVALSTPQKTGWPIRGLTKFIEGKEVVDTKDHELKKLWHHRTKGSKKMLNGQSVEHLLTTELMKRGYCLGVDKKWVPQNVKAL